MAENSNANHEIKSLGLVVTDVKGHSRDDAKILGLIFFGIVLNFVCNRIAVLTAFSLVLLPRHSRSLSISRSLPSR